jgi:four helix bundle protein
MPIARLVVARRFEELGVWQKARLLVRDVYRASNAGPFAKDFELRSQIRRAAISIPSNIAEGYERDGSREFQQFLSQAKGSCGEVRAQLHLARDQGYCDAESHEQLTGRCIEISSMLSGLIRYLQRSQARAGRKFSPAK